MISKSVGTGGDYAHLGLAWAAIVDTTLTDDITFTITSSQNVTSWPAAGKVVDCAGHTITVTTAAAGKHGGNQSAGYVITSSVRMRFNVGCRTNSILSITDLNIRMNLASATANYAFTVGKIAEIGYSATDIITVKNIMLKQIGAGCYGADISAVLYGSSYVDVSDMKIWGFDRGLLLQTPYTNPTKTRRARVEHVSVSSAMSSGSFLVYVRGWDSIKNIVARRIGVLGSCYSSTSTGTFTNCADTDGSLAGEVDVDCVTIVPENEFVSLDVDSDDFMKPLPAGTIGALGATPTFTTDDISSLPIPNGAGQIPIGCHALVYVARRKRLISIF